MKSLSAAVLLFSAVYARANFLSPDEPPMECILLLGVAYTLLLFSEIWEDQYANS